MFATKEAGSQGKMGSKSWSSVVRSPQVCGFYIYIYPPLEPRGGVFFILVPQTMRLRTTEDQTQKKV
jgi:hypothetical protein